MVDAMMQRALTWLLSAIMNLTLSPELTASINQSNFDWISSSKI
jgi:hypothetical protein